MKKLYLPTNNIFSSFRMLTGNTRITVLFQPLWGIPYMLFNFYLSLYMKAQGVTDQQLGYLISLSYVFGTFFSLISGSVVDRLGRKKATLIFDFISWPLTLTLYFLSNNFALFALAIFTSSFVKVVTVAWNLMVIEDANNEQRVSAYNLVSIINIAAGVIIPITGIMVKAHGVVAAERIFLAISVISMATMILVRHRLYKETSVGQRIIDERRKNPLPFNFKNIIPIKAFAVFKGNPKAVVAAMVYILFFLYIPLGTFNSLYFAPFMTEVLGLGESSISILGGAYSVVMLVVFIFVIPIISRRNNTRNMQVGLVIQALSLFLIIVIPKGSLISVVLSIGAYAIGFGIFRPFLDTMLAEVSEGNERASVYSLINTITCIITAMVGLISGTVYLLNPRIIYIISIVILAACTVLLSVYHRMKNSDMNIESKVLQGKQQVGQ